MADNSRIEDLRRRVQRDPASIAFAQLAEECRRAGQFQESVEICRVGLAIHPGYLSARVTLGRALIELNQPDEAQAELDHVLKSAPENLAALRGLGQIHQGRGNLSQALSHYRAALTLARNDPELQETVNDLSLKAEPPDAQASADGVSLEMMTREMDELPPAGPSVPEPAAAAAATPLPFIVGGAPAPAATEVEPAVGSLASHVSEAAALDVEPRAVAPDAELCAIPPPADLERDEEPVPTLDLGTLEAGALQEWVAAEPDRTPPAATVDPLPMEMVAWLDAAAPLIIPEVPEPAAAVAGPAAVADSHTNLQSGATLEPLALQTIGALEHWLEAAPSRIVPPAAMAGHEPGAQTAAAHDSLPTDMIAWLDAAPFVIPEASRAIAPALKGMPDVAGPAAVADDETDIQSGARLDPLALRTIGALEKWLDAIHVSRTHLGA